MALSHSNSALAKRLTRHFAACATVAAASPFLAAELASADVIYTQVAMTVPANIDGLYINVETLATGSAGSVVAGRLGDRALALALRSGRAAGTSSTNTSRRRSTSPQRGGGGSGSSSTAWRRRQHDGRGGGSMATEAARRRRRR